MSRFILILVATTCAGMLTSCASKKAPREAAAPDAMQEVNVAAANQGASRPVEQMQASNAVAPPEKVEQAARTEVSGGTGAATTIFSGGTGTGSHGALFWLYVCLGVFFLVWLILAIIHRVQQPERGTSLRASS